MIRFILVEPLHPNNIGSTARAMKTMGITSLYLVNPRFFPSPAAHAMASGADDILDNAVVVTSLQEALADCELIFATSDRDDNVVRFPKLDVREAAIKAHNAQTQGLNIAFVFGTESIGLSNDQMKFAHYHVRIPTATDFSSLNLSQAVQVIAYELLMATASPTPSGDTASEPANHTETERFYMRFEELLRQVEFLKPGHDKIILQKLRRLFQRAKLEKNEVIIMQGIISNILRHLNLKDH